MSPNTKDDKSIEFVDVVLYLSLTPDVPLDPEEPLVPEDPDVPSDPPATRTSQLAMSLGGGGDPIGMLNTFDWTVYVMFKYKTESPL